MKNPLSMEVFIGKSLINGPVSIGMFDYRRVTEIDAFLELRKWSDIYLITRDKMEESATNQRLEPDLLGTSH